MGYYTRVFCRADRFPALSEIQTYMHAFNPTYRLEGEVDDNNNYWTNFELHYKEGKHPIPVELNWCDEDGSVGKEEQAEFLDQIGRPGLSIKKRKVIRQLTKTKFIICNQLLSDLDEDGYSANDHLMQFFVERYEGMIHAENEGFYNPNGSLLLRSE
jgi:hypothetical protein